MAIGDKLKGLLPGKKKKSRGDDDDDDFEEFEDDEADEDDGEDLDDLDDDDEEGGSKPSIFAKLQGRTKIIVLASVASVVVLGAAAGGWFLFAGGGHDDMAHGDGQTTGEHQAADGGHETAQAQPHDPGVGQHLEPTERVVVDMPPLQRTPPNGGTGATKPASAFGKPSTAFNKPAAPHGGGLTPPPSGAHGQTTPAGQPQQPQTPHPTMAGDGHGGTQQNAEANAAAAHDGPKTVNQIATEGDSGAPGAGIVVPPALAAAFAKIPVPKTPPKPLLAAPDPNLVEQTKDGNLPKIGIDGRMPWQAYGAPSPSNKGLPKIGILVTGLGLSKDTTEVVINRLPPAVSLSFSPYAKDLNGWIQKARAAGHEVILGLPMEPNRFPMEDPGPLALMNADGAPENAKKLNALLARSVGYVGVAPIMGERFMATLHQIRPVLETLKFRGLMFVDAYPSDKSLVRKVATETALPVVYRDVLLDENPSRKRIDLRLLELEGLARKNSAAFAVCSPYPSTIERLAEWAGQLESRKLALTPVSSLASKSAKPR